MILSSHWYNSYSTPSPSSGGMSFALADSNLKVKVISWTDSNINNIFAVTNESFPNLTPPCVTHKSQVGIVKFPFLCWVCLPPSTLRRENESILNQLNPLMLYICIHWPIFYLEESPFVYLGYLKRSILLLQHYSLLFNGLPKRPWKQLHSWAYN